VKNSCQHYWTELDNDWTNGPNWTKLDTDWTNLGQNWTKMDNLCPKWTNLGKMDKSGQQWTKSRKPLMRLGFRLFCHHFCPILSNLDKFVDKNPGNP
jgi:hypothetical protein